MRQSRELPEEAWERLRVAREDLRLAQLGIESHPPILGLSLYHAQQAAEKALKAFLVFRGESYPLTHNMAELARPAIALDESLRDVVEPGLALTGFATLFRYPGAPEEPSAEESRDWLDIAHRICRAVEDRIADAPT